MQNSVPFPGGTVQVPLFAASDSASFFLGAADLPCAVAGSNSFLATD